LRDENWLVFGQWCDTPRYQFHDIDLVLHFGSGYGFRLLGFLKETSFDFLEGFGLLG
jgi:hypothetical protein